ISANGVMAVQRKSDLELCPHAIHRPHQHRLAYPTKIERKEAAEAAQFRQHLWAKGALHGLSHQRFRTGCCINMDSSITIRADHRIFTLSGILVLEVVPIACHKAMTHE